MVFFTDIAFDVEFSKHVQKGNAVDNDKDVQVFRVVAVLGKQSSDVEVQDNAKLDLKNKEQILNT